jgi:hypothetical protein
MLKKALLLCASRVMLAEAAGVQMLMNGCKRSGLVQATV